MRLAANQVSSTAMYFPVARQRCRALSHGSYSMISMDVIASGSYITNYFGSSSKRSSTFWSLMFTPSVRLVGQSYTLVLWTAYAKHDLLGQSPVPYVQHHAERCGAFEQARAGCLVAENWLTRIFKSVILYSSKHGLQHPSSLQTSNVNRNLSTTRPAEFIVDDSL